MCEARDNGRAEWTGNGVIEADSFGMLQMCMACQESAHNDREENEHLNTAAVDCADHVSGPFARASYHLYLTIAFVPLPHIVSITVLIT